MSDFYNEMKEVLNDLPTKTAKDIMITEDFRSRQAHSSSSPSIFAEALVPINPRRWPAFAAGSAVGSDMPEIGDKVLTLLDSLQVMGEYLQTSQSDTQWRARLWTVAEDTTFINMSSELGGDAGAFAAGIASNKIAEKYMDEMYSTAVSLNTQEKLNFEIFKQVAREQGVDVDRVRGTGVAREFVPESMQGDICDRPERNQRPNSWGSNEGLEEDGIRIGPHSNPGNPSNDDGALNLPRESSNDSPSYPDETSLDTNKNDGNIFSKLFGFIGFGGGGGTCDSPVSAPALSPEEADRLRDNSEKTLLGWFFEGGGGYPMCNPDPSHPSNNPPLFLPEYIPPSE